MPEFNFPVDIGNRALQRVGSELMDTNLGFSEISKRAEAVSTCYGKLRRAELQRNIWTFATRKAPIRPVDSTTMLLNPTLWSGTVTYFVGSVVSDALGTLWKSVIRNNLNNQPGQAYSAWVPYFGPLTVGPYNSALTYFAGDLVYSFAGDGTYNVFMSLVGGNAVHPALPNQWGADTVYQTDNVVQRFPAYASGTTYSQGQGVKYTDGNVYVSLTNGNTGNTPPSSGSAWVAMPTLTLLSQLMPTSLFPAPPAAGSTPIDEWQAETVYSLGAFAIFKAAVYLSIANGNTGNFPNAAGSTDWVAVTNGTLYQSLIDLNFGNDPLNAPALWASGTTYAINNLVGGSDGLIYKSLQNSNTGNQPANGASPTFWQSTGTLLPWTTVFTEGSGNSQWMQIGGAAFPSGVGLTALNITYPVGAGPLSQTWSRNVYRLPAGYLKRAPQDPTAGNFSWLGVPGNLSQTDWTIDGNFLVTMNGAPIVLRFIADVQNVQEWPDTFCEGLSCRIALEICEPLTQSTAKKADAASEYQKFMSEARIVGAIEAGSVEPPLDDFIACRQ